nr:hypothetical protein GCM10020093_103810 [Planobispora longispora]
MAAAPAEREGRDADGSQAAGGPEQRPGPLPARRTAQAAVAAGSSPTTTAAWEALAPESRASPLKTGKPNTTPATMTRYDPSRPRGGSSGAPATARKTRAAAPASTARPIATR